MPPNENDITEFDLQRYPTVEQTIVNNASVLYLRKKHFLGDLRQLLNGFGLVLIGIVYLRDILMFSFVIRAFSQYCILNPFPTPTPRIILTDESKKAYTKLLLTAVFSTNAFCFLKHLLGGVYTTSPSADEFLYGGASVQFIGERVPYSKWEILALDVAITCVQLVFHSLMCVTDDSVVLQTAPQHSLDDEDTSSRLEIETDGYNGNVMLIKIDLLANIKMVMNYREQVLYSLPMEETPTTATATIPGVFV